MFFTTDWKVHYNSSRTGIRLIGPKPKWARKDGGEAGLHPSNIHDNAYAIGAVDFTGDMPVILAVDGPSLGGFVCPVTIVQSELWKIGQLRPGDLLRFVCWTSNRAGGNELEAASQDALAIRRQAPFRRARPGIADRRAEMARRTPSKPWKDAHPIIHSVPAGWRQSPDRLSASRRQISSGRIRTAGPRSNP